MSLALVMVHIRASCVCVYLRIPGDGELRPRSGQSNPARLDRFMIAEHLVKPRAELEAEARQVFSDFVDLAAFGRMEIWENEFGGRSWWLRP
jgi:hypothetical protein